MRAPIVRYVLFQVPGWVLAGAVLYGLWPRSGFEPWVGLAVFAGWIAKDFAMWPLLRKSYETDVRTGAADLVGAKGVVQAPIDPIGSVRVRGELWKARAESPGEVLLAETDVEVVGASGMTLTVRGREARAADEPATRGSRSL